MGRVLTAFYDFEVAPASFDFTTFLCTTGIARDLGKCDHVHIVFVPANNPTGFRIDNKPTQIGNKRWRLRHMLAPLCDLIGATHTICATRDDARKYMQGPVWPTNYHVDAPVPSYWFAELARLHRYAPLPEFRADPEAERLLRRYRVLSGPYITITMRHTYGEARNSNEDAWAALRKHVYRKGFWPQVVPDTEDCAWADGVGALAASNPVFRHALYANAAMNMGVNGGPMALCYYGGLPFLQFKMVTDYYSTTPDHFRRMGLPVGTQMPWARWDQKCVWEDDTAETLIREFDDWHSGAMERRGRTA
jgi:hypothetical protein